MSYKHTYLYDVNGTGILENAAGPHRTLTSKEKIQKYRIHLYKDVQCFSVKFTRVWLWAQREEGCARIKKGKVKQKLPDV